MVQRSAIICRFAQSPADLQTANASDKLLQTQAANLNIDVRSKLSKTHETNEPQGFRTL